MNTKLIAACGLMLVWNQTALGQDRKSATNPQNIWFAVEKSAAGPASSLTSSSQVTIQAAQKDAVALIVFTADRWKLELSTPLNKEAQQTDFLNLDGLAAGIGGSFTRSFTFGHLKLREPSTGQVVAESVCRAYGMDLRTQTCSDGTLEEHLTSRGEAPRIVEHALRQFHAQAFEDPSLTGASLTLKAGYKDFKYFTESGDALDAEKFGMSGSLVFFKVSGQSRLSVSATAERAYSDQKTKAQKCAPVTGSTNLTACESRAVGEPVQKDDIIIRAELRKLDRTAGISPVISWRPSSNVIGVDFPVYLVSDDAGRLTGGVRLGFRTDDKFQIAVFVSKPLGLN